MKRGHLAAAIASLLAASCATAPNTGTLGELNNVQADVAEVEVADSLDLALQSYRRYLDKTPTSAMTAGDPFRRKVRSPAPRISASSSWTILTMS